MVRLLFSLFFTMPWWFYGLIAVSFGLFASNLWDEHTARQADTERAIRQGPPATIAVSDYDAYVRVGPMAEVSVRGVIRADLGIGRLSGDTVPKSYIVLDSEDGSGPALAVLFVGTDAQDGLTTLISQADEMGRVTVAGFRRTLNRGEVAGQLRLKDVTREVTLIEPYFGDRATVLRDRSDRDLPFFYLISGLAVFAGLMSVLRYRRWRKRLARRRPMVQHAPAPKTPTPPPMPTEPASPWGADRPQQPPAAPTAVHRRPSASDRQDAGEADTLTLETFESVFPGGGSGFRFKTADEIIRETFGTVSRLSVSEPKE